MSTSFAIPHPPRHWLLGNYRQVARPDRVAQFYEMAKNYGEIYHLKLPTTEFYVVSSFRLVDELCDTTRFEKALSPGLERSRRVVGDGLFTAYNHEPNWERAHRILMPGFSMKAMKDYLPIMNQVADQLLNHWRKHAPRIHDVAADMTRVTLETIALSGFQYSLGSFSNEKVHVFVEAMVRSLNVAVRSAQRHPLANFLAFREKKQVRTDLQTVFELVDRMIEEREKSPELRERRDFLNLMLDTPDRDGVKLSRENIRYQLITFLFAGHETTSGLLSFALYLLSKHPQSLQKAQDEAMTILGTDRTRQPGFPEISRLRYISQVLKEALRLYPTAPGFFLRPIQDTVLGGRYSIKRSERCLVLLSGLHRDSTVWGDDVERFDPDRFAPEVFNKMPINAYRPFGNGPRICIGQNFAMVEATLILARLLQNFDIRDAGYKLRIAEGITIKPEGFFLGIEERRCELH